jgi:hypothetical protein
LLTFIGLSRRNDPAPLASPREHNRNYAIVDYAESDKPGLAGMVAKIGLLDDRPFPNVHSIIEVDAVLIDIRNFFGLVPFEFHTALYPVGVAIVLWRMI